MVKAMGRILASAFVVLLLVVSSAFAEPPIPALTGRVVDQAGILDASTIEAITSQLAGYESSTGNQVVVVTLSELKGYPIEDWGLALGRGWGIGQKGKNNGVLLIVAPNDRELRIEVGYGLEGDLPDATANTIIDSEIVPYFKRGDMKGGVHAGVNAILAALVERHGGELACRAAAGDAVDALGDVAIHQGAQLDLVHAGVRLERCDGRGENPGQCCHVDLALVCRGVPLAAAVGARTVAFAAADGAPTPRHQMVDCRLRYLMLVLEGNRASEQMLQN